MVTVTGVPSSTTITAVNIANNSVTLNDYINIQQGTPITFSGTYDIITVTNIAGMTVNNLIQFFGNSFGLINPAFVYYITAILNSIQIEVGLINGDGSTVFTSSSGTMHINTLLFQIFTITGSPTTYGTSNNLLVKYGNYSSTVYSKKNQTSLAAQFTKTFTFNVDGISIIITTVTIYNIAQVKF